MSPEAMAMRETGEVGNPPGLSVLSSGRYIHFGPFQIDQQRQEVSRNGSRLKLQGKVYQVLMALLEKPGEVVTREELRQRLWPAETHVNYDANVNTTVNKLRQALGDSSDKPLYIETIPRRGYSLLTQPEITDKPGVVAVALLSVPSQNGNSASESAAPSTGVSRSDFWVALGVIGLILAGMLLGAGITRLWISSHFAPVGPGPLLALVSRSLFAL
jgi:DNA-binding winged helix-turn-helix (wHTH) protein